MDLLIDDLLKNQKIDGKDLTILGYFLRSTAPINIEDDESKVDETLPTIDDVIDHLYRHSQSDTEELGLVIQIHGFNTGVKDGQEDYVREDWARVCKYLNQQDKALKDRKSSFVYLGYRWSSESVPSNLKNAFYSLPSFLQFLLYSGLAITALGIFFLILFSSPWFWIFIVLGVCLASFIGTLFILRVIVYFRDGYRARYFAVPDLIEFIRQLDQGLIQRSKDVLGDAQKAQEEWNQKRIKLTFIGHSMGGFITTEVVRVLSDAFDPEAIGNVDNLNKRPSSNIGRVFSLGRLILVSPDIPVNTILSGRTNFLRSSLRRFEEAYLFSNEGDVALRLASTAANYFSFPASTRTQGYRLGNVTVNLPDTKVYGIVNLKQILSAEHQLFYSNQKFDHLLKYLGVKVLNKRQERNLLQNKKDPESLVPKGKDPESIADLFTYFDCTEYQDETDYPGREGKTINVLICPNQKSPLNFWQYIKILKAFFDSFSNSPTGIDVHGGYFHGSFCKLVIYRLAFVGFQGLLDSLILEQPNEFNLVAPPDLQEKLNRSGELNTVEKHKVALEYFSWICEQKSIQVAASSERYYVDVLNESREKVRCEFLSQQKND
ncbi:alpha/beta hydrolase [Brasilonema bromeliae]|uniref:Alpha/beta hydrolase n=1 Tax=Brasilonema bromeliae SPC951 TaxID=385972 RepID=A0ABX1P6J3_9CYAN|nr:alpha/beta hydrolase [Brasilonema bromeliae]NMG20005.1 hypothetical protein [Brasilonema bromeliae SPC951]